MTLEGTPVAKEGLPSTTYVSIANLALICGLNEQHITKRINAAIQQLSIDSPTLVRTNQDTGITEYNAAELIKVLRSANMSHGKFPSKKQKRRYSAVHGRLASGLQEAQHTPNQTSKEQGDPSMNEADPQSAAEVHASGRQQSATTHMFHDEAYLPVRQELESVYTNIEDLLREKADGTIDVHGLAKILGDLASDTPSEETLEKLGITESVAQHSRRLQILAFDTLVQALNALDPTDTVAYDTLGREIIAQLSDTSMPAKRAYLTGILMHHLDAALAGHGAPEDVDGGVLGIVDAAERCAAFLRKELPDQEGVPYLQCCTDIMNGFSVQKIEHAHMSEHERELEEARLIAALYENPRSVMDIDLDTRTQEPYEPAATVTTSELLTGNPHCYVILPQGYTPSEEKILEAIRFGWHLGPALVVSDPSTPLPRKRPVILCPTDDSRVRMLIRAARDAKNLGDFRTHVEKLTELETYARTSLDPKATQEIRAAEQQGSRVEIRFMTIRDKRPNVAEKVKVMQRTAEA